MNALICFLYVNGFYHITCTRGTARRSAINFNYHQAFTPRFTGLMYNVQYPLLVPVVLEKCHASYS